MPDFLGEQTMCKRSSFPLCGLLAIPLAVCLATTVTVSAARAQNATGEKKAATDSKDSKEPASKDAASKDAPKSSDSKVETKSATDTPKESTKQNSRSTKDAGKDVKSATSNTRESAKDSATDSSKNTRDRAGDRSKAAQDAAKNSGKDSRDSVRDSAKDARDTSKQTRDSSRDTRDNAKNAGRDDARTTPDTTRDSKSGRDARETRDRRDTRDSRDALDTRDSRDSRNVRDSRDTQTRSDSRDTVRDTTRRDRTDVRESRDSSRISRSQIRNFRADSVTTRDLGLTFGRATDRGLVIENISRSAVLADVGFHRNDVIVSVADHRVHSDREFIRWLFAEDLRNEPITIIVLRDDREVPIEVRPAEIIEQLVVVHDDFDPLMQFGVVLDDSADREIVVRRVIPDSPAFVAGIRAGDVITTFHGQRIAGPQQFVQVLETAQPGEVAVEVSRNRQTREFQVDVPRMERRAATPGVERRQDRRDLRTERREERREGVTTQPAQPATPAQPAQPARPGILPRNR
jgi:hypothetical protein